MHQVGIEPTSRALQASANPSQLLMRILVGLVGIEPTMGFRRRIKSPLRSTTTETIPDLAHRVGIEPTRVFRLAG